VGQHPPRKNPIFPDEELDRKHQGKQGTIIVEFFETTEVLKKAQPQHVHTKVY